MDLEKMVNEIKNNKNKDDGDDIINIEVPKSSICDISCPYFGYQCNVNKMFKECKKN